MTIESFQGEYQFLSNFWPAEVELDGQRYPTVEHAYQAAKTLHSGQRRTIQTAPRPGIAKSMGKRVHLREDWNSDTKLAVMGDLLRQKFSSEPLRTKLQETGEEEIREGNDWGDTFWGVFKGRGENNLGKMLMFIRADLQVEDIMKKGLTPEQIDELVSLRPDKEEA